MKAQVAGRFPANVARPDDERPLAKQRVGRASVPLLDLLPMLKFGKLPHEVQQSGQRKFGQRLGMHTGGSGDLDLACPVPIGLGSCPHPGLGGLDPAKVRAVFAPFLGFAPVEVKRDLGFGKMHSPFGQLFRGQLSRTAHMVAVELRALAGGPVDRRLRPRELRGQASPPALLADTNKSTTVDAHSPRLDVFCFPLERIPSIRFLAGRHENDTCKKSVHRQEYRSRLDMVGA